MTDPRTFPAGNHLTALDSLRGLAAVSVVLFHIRLLAETVASGPLFTLGFADNSYLMVDFFFVLSGFVIALNYAERIPDPPAAARFLWLRFWRLYPLHLAFLLVMLAIEGAKWLAQTRLGIEFADAPFAINGGWAFVNNLLLAQSFHLEPALTFNIPAWSIGAEFYTYIVFALILLTTRRLMAVAALIVVASCLFLARVSPDGLYVMADYGFIRCLFGFFLGVLGCGVYRRMPRLATAATERSAYLAAAAILLVILLLSWKPAPAFDFAVPPLATVVVVTLALAHGTPLARFLSARPLAWLGTVSYSIYMSHWAVLLVITNLLQKLDIDVTHLFGNGAFADTVLIAICLAPVLALSHLTYRYIETPFRDWSRRVRSSAPAAVSGATAARSG